jgi:hypothetical protein
VGRNTYIAILSLLIVELAACRPDYGGVGGGARLLLLIFYKGYVLEWLLSGSLELGSSYWSRMQLAGHM